MFLTKVLNRSAADLMASIENQKEKRTSLCQLLKREDE